MRVAKSGSQALMLLINKYLSKFNHFQTKSQPETKILQQIWSRKRQVATAEKVAVNEDSFLFNGLHENFIDFNDFDLPQPIYISLIRDPVEKVISWFYYERSELFNPEKKGGAVIGMTEEEKLNWYNKDFKKCVLSSDPECLYIPYTSSSVGYRKQSKQFCGNYYQCTIFNSPTAIQMAKLNVEKNFAVVGSWEDTNITLTVLEHYIPRYFRGAKELYYFNFNKIRNHNRNQKRPMVSENIKELLRKNFTNEIEFYNFCKQRLYKQYIAIKFKKLNQLKNE